ncbi:DNA translocase FtsK, partial [Clostridioides difficile]
NEIILTSREFDILYLLANNKGRVYSTEEIFEKVWKEKYYQSNRVNTSKGSDEDEFLSEAIEFVVESGQASASMLQRRFKIGFNRA